MNGETQGKLMVGLFGGIVLMLILQFAIITELTSYIGSHRDSYIIFLPFMLLVLMSIALFWLLERMPK